MLGRDAGQAHMCSSFGSISILSMRSTGLHLCIATKHARKLLPLFLLLFLLFLHHKTMVFQHQQHEQQHQHHHHQQQQQKQKHQPMGFSQEAIMPLNTNAHLVTTYWAWVPQNITIVKKDRWEDGEMREWEMERWKEGIKWKERMRGKAIRESEL